MLFILSKILILFKKIIGRSIVFHFSICVCILQNECLLFFSLLNIILSVGRWFWIGGLAGRWSEGRWVDLIKHIIYHLLLYTTIFFILYFFQNSINHYVFIRLHFKLWRIQIVTFWKWKRMNTHPESFTFSFLFVFSLNPSYFLCLV